VAGTELSNAGIARHPFKHLPLGGGHALGAARARKCRRCCRAGGACRSAGNTGNLAALRVAVRPLELLHVPGERALDVGTRPLGGCAPVGLLRRT
jgi:hypothetical protein